MSAQPWLEGIFAAIDRMDAEAFAAHLVEDAVFRYANLPAVEGRGAIREFVAGFFKSVRGIAHELLESWQAGDALICRGEVTYTRHDGSTLTVPFANIFRLSGERVRDYLIYVDASALYSH